MRLTQIPQLYRNAQRWREILAVLSKHGLADWLSNAERGVAGRLFPSRGTTPRGVRREERVRLAMEELGVTFIKLGQVLATRPDQVGVELADELAKLQTAVPADPPEVVARTVTDELGASIEERFSAFDLTPVASGSIGQVHRARLHDGSEVAVKVRHPGVPRRVAVDSEILVGLAELAERLPDLEPYRPQATAREFQRTLSRELDFRDELRRIEQFREAFADDPRLRIPRPYADHSSERVLTLEWIDGVKLSDEAFSGSHTSANGGAPTTEARERLALHGAEVFLEMIFDHGLYHADPHPGNLLVTPDGAIGLLDFGMVGRLSDSLREELEDVLIAIAADDS
ncbi:MAG: AarF/ABC1/UbiB kinase family protein, partial [Planctomycetota bacterium]